MKLLLIGPPASGKGTISRLLGSYLKLPAISVGKILRALPQEHEHYETINECMRKGLLVPNHMVAVILKQELSGYIYKDGYILEGWARDMKDIEEFDPNVDKVLYLELAYEISKQRVTARRVCEKSGHTYNLITNPPKKKGFCDFDGSKLIQREDDKEEVLLQRWQVFTERTVPCIKYFDKLNKLVKLDASPMPEEIFEEAKKALVL